MNNQEHPLQESGTAMALKSQFHLCQIVYLEHGNTRLYAEVIQVIESRQICWVRPLGLVIVAEDNVAEDNVAEDNVAEDNVAEDNVAEDNVAEDNGLAVAQPLTRLYDLRQTSDILWSIAFFQPALDTDILPLLSYLEATREPSEQLATGQHQLRHFMAQVWSGMSKSEFKSDSSVKNTQNTPQTTPFF